MEAGAGAAPRTRKPGQSAHAEATQGVFPCNLSALAFYIRKRKLPQLANLSGTNFCTEDFAPLEPEFGAEFWETNFERPNFGPEFLGRSFDPVFPTRRGPQKIHPQEIHLPKSTFQNSTQKSHRKIHIAPLQGHLVDNLGSPE